MRYQNVFFHYLYILYKSIIEMSMLKLCQFCEKIKTIINVFNIMFYAFIQYAVQHIINSRLYNESLLIIIMGINLYHAFTINK